MATLSGWTQSRFSLASWPPFDTGLCALPLADHSLPVCTCCIIVGPRSVGCFSLGSSIGISPILLHKVLFPVKVLSRFSLFSNLENLDGILRLKFGEKRPHMVKTALISVRHANETNF